MGHLQGRFPAMTAFNANDNKKPRLKNLDDLFAMNNGINPLEQTVSVIESLPHHKRVVTYIPIDDLVPFKNHPFHLYEGERLDDMVSSIRKNGVLVPLIVRKVNSILEILSGHNRKISAKIAGLTEVPVIILDNISDEDAMVYVIETNLLQRSFTDMTHSEKAAVIAMHHSKMFSQGKRNDILEQLKMLENPQEYKAYETSTQVAKKLTTIEKIGESYNLSKDTVARYLRINQLIPALKECLDKNHIAFIPAVTLSFLKEDEQELIKNSFKQNINYIDIKKANIFLQYSKKGKLNSENINRILSGEVKPKSNRTPLVKINKKVFGKYFKSNQSAKEIQDIIEKALEMYFNET